MYTTSEERLNAILTVLDNIPDPGMQYWCGLFIDHIERLMKRLETCSEAEDALFDNGFVDRFAEACGWRDCEYAYTLCLFFSRLKQAKTSEDSRLEAVAMTTRGLLKNLLREAKNKW